MKVLATGGAPDWVAKELQSLGHELVIVAADAYVDEQKFIEGIQGFDVYISGGIETCPKAVIDSASTLKAIVFLGVDPTNYIALDAAKARNIPVFTTPGANARAVAEHTILLMLTAIRKTAMMLENIQKKTWKAETGFELQGKTLGLIGAGPIAQNVAKIANGFDMNVLYWTRSGEKESMNGTFTERENLFEQSDIISLHVPKDAGAIIDEQALQKLKDGAVLINTAPALLVNLDALYNALKSNKLSCAAFDCFYAEGDDAFTCDAAELLTLSADRFFITPHAAWRTTEADDNMFKMAIESIKKTT